MCIYLDPVDLRFMWIMSVNHINRRFSFVDKFLVSSVWLFLTIMIAIARNVFPSSYRGLWSLKPITTLTSMHICVS